MVTEGRTIVALDAATLSATLTDPEALERVLPGVDDVEVDEDGRFSARLQPGTQLGVTPFDLVWTVVENRPGERLRVVGRSAAGEYAVDLDVTLDLAAERDGTAVAWQADARFAGTLSSLGQRVLPMLVAHEVDRVLSAAGIAGA
jgi:carbon monoxide dehydrogenase subunit G